MIRILIWLPVYALIVVVLPQSSLIQTLTEPLYSIPVSSSALICTAALVLSLLGLLTLNYTQRGLFGAGRSFVWDIASYTILGLFVAAAWGLFEYWSNQPPALEYLVFMPAAFAISEMAVLLLTQVPTPVRRQGATAPDPQTKAARQPTSKLLMRLLIWPPIYGVIVFLLPTRPEIQGWLAPLQQVHPDIRFLIAVAALPLAAAAVLIPPLLLNTSSAGDGRAGTPQWRYHVLVAGALGLAFAAVFSLFGRFSQIQINLSDFILIPIGFALAEGAILAVMYRLDHGPLGQ